MDPSADWPPPPNVVLRVENFRLVRNTYSWLFIPVLAHALGRPELFPHMNPTNMGTLTIAIALLAAHFAAHGITFRTVFGSGVAQATQCYIAGSSQEFWLNQVPLAGQIVQAYGIAAATAAENAFQPVLDQLLAQNTTELAAPSPNTRRRQIRSAGQRRRRAARDEAQAEADRAANR